MLNAVSSLNLQEKAPYNIMHDDLQEVFKMLKNDVIKRLDELQGCEKLEFELEKEIKCLVHTHNIRNYPDSGMLESVADNFKAPYCAIVSIYPCS